MYPPTNRASTIFLHQCYHLIDITLYDSAAVISHLDAVESFVRHRM